MDEYVRLAEKAVRNYILTGKEISSPGILSPEMQQRRGVFVSLKKEGRLRGCIGTFLPSELSVANEIIANAVKSATADPRFPPVQEDELDKITYSVDVLSQPEECQTEDLDPRKYGVIVESGMRRGLLLPDLQGIDSVGDQLQVTRGKAGIGADEPIRLQRFTVKRHT